jgi:hypothetical protein
LAIVLTVVAVRMDWPLKVGFAVSRPAMDRLAQGLITSGNTFEEDQWVGVYKAKRIWRVGDGVRFVTDDSDVSYTAGFVYLPQADPRRSKWSSYKYVGEKWWAWRRDGR